MEHDLQAAAVALTAISAPSFIAGKTDKLAVLTEVADHYKAWLQFLIAYHPQTPAPPVAPVPVVPTIKV